MRAHNAGAVVDGNVIAGLLSEVFSDDVTSLIGVCACGSAAALAEAVVEIDDVAAIVRCRGCTHTLVTVLRDVERVRIVVGSLRELARE
ncbi:MAG: DUF6510 family protein [Microbacterium sp.]